MESVRSRAALVVLLTIAAYLPVRNAGFVYDDTGNIIANQSLRSLQGLKWIWADPRASLQYYPLTYTSFWVEYHLWGLRPAGYHVVNVLLHASNAVLVGLLLSRLGVPGAWLAALLFALHPVHVESVAWISERKNVLSGFFYLSSMLTYLGFEAGAKRRWAFYALSLTLFVCAMLSKTSAVSMPFAVLLVVWWKRGRIKWPDVVSLIPFVLVGAVLGLLTAWLEIHQSGAHGPEWEMSWLARCLVAGRVVWFYAGKLIWPYPLMAIYPRWQIDTAVWWQYLFPSAAGAVVLALWRWRGRLGKARLVGVAFFAGSLVPVPAFINIAFMRYSYVAEHWQYLSSIGLIAVAAALGMSVWRRMGPWQRPWGAVLGMVALAVLGVTTWRQSRVYANEETLWRDNVEKNPDAWGAHNNLGFALQAQGRIGDAIVEYQQALRLKPDYAEAQYNLGVALGQEGKLEDSIEHYEQALRIRPNLANARNNLGEALMRAGRTQEAIGQYEEALRIRPDHAEAHYNLGIALARSGRVSEAVAHWEEAVQIRPDYAEAHNNLAIVLARAGRMPEAIGHWEQALRIKPDSAEIHNNLGSALARLGRLPDAISQWEQALRLNPDDAKAHYNLGIALEETGRVTEAIEHYERALRLDPRMTEAQDRLERLRTVR
ncbi:MAG TPA: tetratricopeptide repeat protein [Verrucomicrobiae bacterium]|nr:tetratricopeptide repeat protein [Verrucomicrobiae bacterium]